jgi:hypothetical protein
LNFDSSFLFCLIDKFYFIVRLFFELSNIQFMKSAKETLISKMLAEIKGNKSFKMETTQNSNDATYFEQKIDMSYSPTILDDPEI